MDEPNAGAMTGRERQRGRSRRHYLKNREQIIERSRQYAADNRDKIREYKRQLYMANRARVLEQRRIYYAQNRDEIRERQKAYRVTNRDRRLASARQARHQGLSPEDWATLWEAQQGNCYLCGGEMAAADAHVDHDHGCCPAKTSCPACRRGLAHGFCNIAVGYAGDDPERLRRMADALELAKADVTTRMARRQDGKTLF